MPQNTLYGSHICGEGGEYETLTIDSPMFKSRILLLVLSHSSYPDMLSFPHSKEVETVIHSDSDFATVAYLRVKEVELETKDTEGAPDLPVPPVLDEKYSELLDDDFETAPELGTLSLDGEAPTAPSTPISPTSSRQLGDWVSVSNVQRNSELSNNISIGEEVTECFQLLSGTLPRIHCMS